MIKLLLVVCAFILLMTYPELLLLAAAVFAGMYIMKKKPDSFDRLAEAAREGYNEPEPVSSGEVVEEEPEYKTTQQLYKEDLDRKLKPGFENDPEWQEKAEKIRKHMEKVEKTAAEEEIMENKSRIGYI